MNKERTCQNGDCGKSLNGTPTKATYCGPVCRLQAFRAKRKVFKKAKEEQSKVFQKELKALLKKHKVAL